MDFARAPRRTDVDILRTDGPFVIVPGCAPPLPEIREMMVDGEMRRVICETACVPAGTFGVLDVLGVADPPRPCYRSVWDMYGLRRRPRRS